MQLKEMFGIPLYSEKFEEHQKYKPQVMEFLNKPDAYWNCQPNSKVKLSSPQLEKEPEFAPFVDFFIKTMKKAYLDMGFYPNFEITGMWSARQVPGANHHRHIHKNTFLIGCYYLDGDAGCGGTTFMSPIWNHYNIYPPKYPGLPSKVLRKETSPFEEGKLIIWPAWVEHGTEENFSGRERTILAFNTMPLGKTNSDPFERYHYQSIEGLDLHMSYKENVK